jgi:hypothetical protein
MLSIGISAPGRGVRMTRLAAGMTAIIPAMTGVTGVISAKGSEKAPARSPDATEFHEGQMFPTTVFPSLDGRRPGSVGDFRGKKLIPQIFASW